MGLGMSDFVEPQVKLYGSTEDSIFKAIQSNSNLII